jgi:uncharacterized protein YbjT (DUF2867 family)
MGGHTGARHRPIIAVLGGTGRFGAPYVDEFIGQGLTVRILARSPQKAAARFPGAEVRQGSMLGFTQVKDIMNEAAAAFLITPVGGNDDAGIELAAATCAIKAARATRLPHLIYLSLIQPTAVTGVPMLDVKGRIEMMAQAGGLPFSSLRTGCYMDAWLDFFPLFMRLGLYLMPIGPGHRFSFTAQRDVARIAGWLIRHERIIGGAIDVVDPRPRSVTDVVHLFRAIAGRRMIPAGRWLVPALLPLRPTIFRWLYPKGASRVALFDYLSRHDWIGDAGPLAAALPWFRATAMEDYLMAMWP